MINPKFKFIFSLCLLGTFNSHGMEHPTTYKQTQKIKLPNAITLLGMTLNDPITFVAGGYGESLEIYEKDATTNEFTFMQDIGDAVPESGLLSLAMSSDGGTIVALTGDKLAFVYQKNQKTGQYEQLQTLTADLSLVVSIHTAITSDGSTLVIPGGQSTNVYQKNLSTGKYNLEQQLSIPEDDFNYSAAITPDGATLVTTGQHETYVYQRANNKYNLIQTIELGAGIPSITQDGTTLLITKRKSIFVLKKDSKTNEYDTAQAQNIAVSLPVRNATVTADGETIIVYLPLNRKFIVYQKNATTDTFMQAQQMQIPIQEAIKDWAIAADGKTLVTGSNNGVVVYGTV